MVKHIPYHHIISQLNGWFYPLHSHIFPCKTSMWLTMVQIYIYIYIYTHIYIHTHTHIYIYTYPLVIQHSHGKWPIYRWFTMVYLLKKVIFHDCHKQCKDMRTASGSAQDPGRNPRHPQISKLTYFRTLQSYTRKGSKTSFCEWQR